MQSEDFGWSLVRWNIAIAIAAAILTFVVGGFDPAVATLG